MRIDERYQNLETIKEETYRRITRSGEIENAKQISLQEHVLDVYINDVLSMKVICTPEYLTELVLGRLLTEGFIASAEEVVSVYICEYGRRAKVFLEEKELPEQNADEYVEQTPTCCTGNHILNDYFITNKELKAVQPIPWKQEWIFRLADQFSKDTKLHKTTMSTHSCILAKGEELLFQCEDIGRHNALDKVIGYALRNGINLTECILYSSGRVPTDMVYKAIRAGVPVFVSKASVSAQGAELAREYGLTMISSAREDYMKLLSGPDPN